MNLLLFCLISIGITTIITGGKIFDKPRNLIGKLHPMVAYMLCCPMCMGIYVGMVVSLTGYQITNVFYDGCISSCVNYLYHGVMVYYCKEDC